MMILASYLLTVYRLLAAKSAPAHCGNECTFLGLLDQSDWSSTTAADDSTAGRVAQSTESLCLGIIEGTWGKRVADVLVLRIYQ